MVSLALARAMRDVWIKSLHETVAVMSHDIHLKVDSATDPVVIFDYNVTYNYQPAFAACGMDSLSELDGMRAGLSVIILKHLLKTLKKRPEYGDLIRGGGTWGTLKTLTECLQKMLKAAEAWPDGIWHVY